MHDARALAYEVDTVVEDVDDWNAPTRISTVARSRVATGDLTVHVLLMDHVDGTNDGWHKLAPNGYETACGIEFGMRDEVDRRVERELAHPLNVNCDCWTRKERSDADKKHLEQFGFHYQPRKKRQP